MGDNPPSCGNRWLHWITCGVCVETTEDTIVAGYVLFLQVFRSPRLPQVRSGIVLGQANRLFAIGGSGCHDC